MISYIPILKNDDITNLVNELHRGINHPSAISVNDYNEALSAFDTVKKLHILFLNYINKYELEHRKP